MGEVVQLGNASLSAGPASVSDGSVFPASNVSTPLSFTPQVKPYTVSTGIQLPIINSPNTFAPLPGLGSSGPVTQAHTLYMRTQGPIQVQVTYQGGGSPSPQFVYGLMVIEAPPGNPITGVAVQGSGQIEWLAVGNL